MTTDPAGQYNSPYLGMGNNPINGVDSDGGRVKPEHHGTGDNTTVAVMDEIDLGSTADIRSLTLGEFYKTSQPVIINFDHNTGRIQTLIDYERKVQALTLSSLVLEILGLQMNLKSSTPKNKSFNYNKRFSHVESPNFTFGLKDNHIHHTFRHVVEESGIEMSVVKRAVEKHFKTVSSQLVKGKTMNQVIKIQGKRIQYSAHIIPKGPNKGKINIGRIHEVK